MLDISLTYRSKYSFDGYAMPEVIITAEWTTEAQQQSMKNVGQEYLLNETNDIPLKILK